MQAHIKRGKDIVFVDESYFIWSDNMLKCWQYKDARIILTKEQINTRNVKLIAGISKRISLCSYKLVTGSLNGQVFLRFIDNLLLETGN